MGQPHTANDHAPTAQVLVSNLNGVTTLTMNRPRKLNGWTLEMMAELEAEFQAAAQNPDTKVLVLTGAGHYYCAGVNLGGSLHMGHPKVLHGMITQRNQALFDMFLDFPKPLLIAVNGPAIGASVTSATLSNAIIAAKSATFSTPFAALGVCPEGCSSIHFDRILGPGNAERMLETEGWKPNAQEALDAGLVQWVVEPDELIAKAQEIAEEWISQGTKRAFRGGSTLEELKAVNARESVEVANAFMSAPFMKAQYRFMWSKKKRVPAAVFLTLWLTRPLWARLL